MYPPPPRFSFCFQTNPHGCQTKRDARRTKTVKCCQTALIKILLHNPLSCQFIYPSNEFLLLSEDKRQPELCWRMQSINFRSCNQLPQLKSCSTKYLLLFKKMIGSHRNFNDLKKFLLIKQCRYLPASMKWCFRCHFQRA